MHHQRPSVTRIYWRIFLWFYLVFAVLVFLMMLPGALTGHGEPLGNALVAALFAFSGPFDGMVSRSFNSSYGTPGIVPFCSVVLGASLLSFFIPLPFKRFARTVHGLLWGIGLLIWYAGGLIAILNANS